MNTATQHPTGVAALATTVLVYLAQQLGADLPAEVAAAIVGLIAVAVSTFSPRVTVPESGVGAGPDPDDLPAAD